MIQCQNCSGKTDDYYIFRDKQFGRKKVEFCRECYEDFMRWDMRQSFIENRSFNNVLSVDKYRGIQWIKAF